MNELQQLKQIVDNAPDGWTHYHMNFKKYFKLKECEWTAKIFINKEWEDYPLYPSLRSRADIERIIDLLEEKASS